MSDKIRFFSLSGGLGLQLTPAVAKLLLPLLRELYPNQEFELLSSPFSRQKNHFRFSSPLLLSAEENCLHVTSRLAFGWGTVNEYNFTNLRPALERGKIVIVLRYGLDLYLYAILCASLCGESEKVLDLLKQAHRANAELWVLESGIPAPQYMVPWVDFDRIEELITPEWITSNRWLGNIDAVKLRRVIQQEQDQTVEYCAHPRQRKECRIRAALTAEAMAKAAAEAIGAYL